MAGTRPGGDITSIEDLDVDPRGGRVLTIIGGIFALVTLAWLPFLMGPLAMTFGTLGHVKRDPWGMRVAVAGGVFMILSLSLQALFFGSGGVAA